MMENVIRQIFKNNKDETFNIITARTENGHMDAYIRIN